MKYLALMLLIESTDQRDDRTGVATDLNAAMPFAAWKNLTEKRHYPGTARHCSRSQKPRNTVRYVDGEDRFIFRWAPSPKPRKQLAGFYMLRSARNPERRRLQLPSPFPSQAPGSVGSGDPVGGSCLRFPKDSER